MKPSKILFAILAVSVCRAEPPKKMCSEVEKELASDWKCELNEPLGLGGFAITYLMKNSKGESGAVKCRWYNTQDLKDKVDTELEILKACSNENVAKMLLDKQADGLKYTILELGEKGTLTKDISREEPFFRNPRFVMRMFLGILKGVQHIHAAGYIHGDIKSDNVIVTQDNTPKIIDFDLARPPGNYKTITGSPLYFDPRLLDDVEDKPYDHKNDVYALGVLLYQMSQGGRMPFDTNNLDSLYQMLDDGDYRLAVNSEASVVSLSNWALQHDPVSRPTLAEMIQATEAYLASPQDQFVKAMKLSNKRAVKPADLVVTETKTALKETEKGPRKSRVLNI